MQLLQPGEDDEREGHERAGEVFLVDRDSELFGVPGVCLVGEDHVPNAGVHQPNLLNGADAAAGTGQAFRVEDLGDHPAGLKHPTHRPLFEECRAIEHLHALFGGVCRRQRVEAEDHENLRPVVDIDVLATDESLSRDCYGSRRDLQVVVEGLGEIGRQFLIVAKQRQ